MGLKELFQTKPIKPFTNFLIGEINTYNSLLKLMDESLREIKNCIIANRNFDKLGEDTWEDLRLMKVPKAWQNITYPTNQPIGDWMKNIIKKVEYIRNWMTNGEPRAFWIPAFISFKGFLAALNQVYISSNKISGEKIEYDFEIFEGNVKSIVEKVEEGAIVYGLRLINGVWDIDTKSLDLEGKTNVMPPIHIKIINASEEKKETYKCPLYRTSEIRNEVLLHINLPIKNETTTWNFNRTALILEADQ